MISPKIIQFVGTKFVNTVMTSGHKKRQKLPQKSYQQKSYHKKSQRMGVLEWA